MEKAVVHARILCTIAPDKPAYRRVLAECLYNSGQVPAAAEAFRLLLNMPHSPAQHDVNVLLNFARCLHDLGDLDGSHSYFNSVLAQEPSHADAILGIAAVGIAKLRQVSAASTTSAARSPSASSSTGTASSGAGKAGASLEASLQESPHPAPLSSHAPVHRCNTHTHTYTRARTHTQTHTHTHRDQGSLRTPREEWMERQLGGEEQGVEAATLSRSVESSSLALSDQVGAALTRLRQLLKNRSGSCVSH
jgi:hypothetical protein